MGRKIKSHNCEKIHIKLIEVTSPEHIIKQPRIPQNLNYNNAILIQNCRTQEKDTYQLSKLTNFSERLLACKQPKCSVIIDTLQLNVTVCLLVCPYSNCLLKVICFKGWLYSVAIRPTPAASKVTCHSMTYGALCLVKS